MAVTKRIYTCLHKAAALFPRWESAYGQLVTVPSGKSYIVSSGMKNDRKEG